MSQMPEVAGSWPEEGTQYVPGAPMEPVQQAYPPQAPYQNQQPYQQQQGYPEQQQYQQAQPQQQYAAQPQYQQQYQEQTAPQQAMFEEEQSSVPSEFDHLFRDSVPTDRRSISGRQPVVSGPGAPASPGFPQQQAQQQMQPAQAAPQAATAMFNPAQQQAQPYDAAGRTEHIGQFGGYDGPGGPGSGGPGSGGGRRTPLIIGGVVALIAAVGLYLGLSGGGSSNSGASAGSTTSSKATASSTETAQQQADAVYVLVKQAKTLRSDINGGVDNLLACDVTDAKTKISATAQARQSSATQVAALPVGKINGAAALVSALQTAWQDSATSDQAYAKAASDFAGGGCSAAAVKADSNYQAAQSESGSTASAKSAAAKLWNSVMTNYEPSISESDL